MRHMSEALFPRFPPDEEKLFRQHKAKGMSELQFRVAVLSFTICIITTCLGDAPQAARRGRSESLRPMLTVTILRVVRVWFCVAFVSGIAAAYRHRPLWMAQYADWIFAAFGVYVSFSFSFNDVHLLSLVDRMASYDELRCREYAFAGDGLAGKCSSNASSVAECCAAPGLQPSIHHEGDTYGLLMIIMGSIYLSLLSRMQSSLFLCHVLFTTFVYLVVSLALDDLSPSPMTLALATLRYTMLLFITCAFLFIGARASDVGLRAIFREVQAQQQELATMEAELRQAKAVEEAFAECRPKAAACTMEADEGGAPGEAPSEAAAADSRPAYDAQPRPVQACPETAGGRSP